MSIRKILSDIVGRECEEDTVAVLLSGGVDSLTCAFAANDCGKKVVAYTFQIGEWESSDSVSARRCSELFGWEFNLIKVPLAKLKDDFLSLASKYHCQSKTQFECTYPFMYVFPEIKERCVISGVAADGHYGLSRKAMSAVCKSGISKQDSKKVFDSFRVHYFHRKDNPAGVRQLEMLSDEYDKVFCSPYLDDKVYDFFIKLHWKQINKPKQKMPILMDYKDEFKRCGTREHSNLQLNSGVDKIFKTLLKSELNTKNRKMVLHLCKDYASG
jgi:asparagine synthetase B (glutamine-hydrolysing)